MIRVFSMVKNIRIDRFLIILGVFEIYAPYKLIRRLARFLT